MFILSRSIVLRESLLLGVGMWVAGVAIDLYTIYIVHREMDEIRTDIETARDDIQNAQEEILQTEMKVEDTAQLIDGPAVDIYDRHLYLPLTEYTQDGLRGYSNYGKYVC